jgi:hypothetical protein
MALSWWTAGGTRLKTSFAGLPEPLLVLALALHAALTDPSQANALLVEAAAALCFWLLPIVCVVTSTFPSHLHTKPHLYKTSSNPAAQNELGLLLLWASCMWHTHS